MDSKARAAALKTGAVEVRAVIEDCRSHCLGGLSVRLYIYALLNDSQTWMAIDDEAVGNQEDLQSNFLRVLLATPASIPSTYTGLRCHGDEIWHHGKEAHHPAPHPQPK